MTPSRPSWICPETGKPHEFTPDVEYDAARPPLNCEHCGTAKAERGATPPRLSAAQQSCLAALSEHGAQHIITPAGMRTARSLVDRGLAHWQGHRSAILLPGPAAAPRKEP